jgi:beta-galactosidase
MMQVLKFIFGADYHPEHWPRSRWDIDAKLMAELGFNVVRLAEFLGVRSSLKMGYTNLNGLMKL